MTARDDTSNAQATRGIKIEFITDVAGIAGIKTGLFGMSTAISSPPVSEQAQARYLAERWVVRKARSSGRSLVEVERRFTPTGFEIKTTGAIKLVG